jgi:hypothetical protein
MYIFLFFLASLSILFVFVKEISQLWLALIEDADEDAANESHHDYRKYNHDPDGDAIALLTLLTNDRETRLHVTIETDRLSRVVIQHVISIWENISQDIFFLVSKIAENLDFTSFDPQITHFIHSFNHKELRWDGIAVAIAKPQSEIAHFLLDAVLVAPLVKELALVVSTLETLVIFIDTLQLHGEIHKLFRWKLDSTGEGIDYSIYFVG